MKGISSRSNLHAGNWPTSLAEKLKIHWRTGGLSGNPPFVSQRRREAAAYALLPLENRCMSRRASVGYLRELRCQIPINGVPLSSVHSPFAPSPLPAQVSFAADWEVVCRVTALRILCELRLDREDLHNVVEHALHPPKKTKAERKAIQMALKAGKSPPPEPALPTMNQMRREPLAHDSSGLLYWYLDYQTTTGAASAPNPNLCCWVRVGTLEMLASALARTEILRRHDKTSNTHHRINGK